MLRSLWRSATTSGWMAFPQMTVTMADMVPMDRLSGIDRLSADHERRIDMLLVRESPNRERTGVLETLAVEVKVSRSDYFADLRDPAKQAPWVTAATRHAFAVPEGLIRPDEHRSGSGLMFIDVHAPMPSITWVREPQYVPGHRPQLPLRVWRTIMSRLTYMDARDREWGFAAPNFHDPQTWRNRAYEAEKLARKAEKSAERALAKAAAWQAAFALAAPDGLPCSTCGEGLRPLHPEHGWFRSWRHLDPAATACANPSPVDAVDPAPDET